MHLSITHEASAELGIDRHGPIEETEDTEPAIVHTERVELRALSIATMLEIFLYSYSKIA